MDKIQGKFYPIQIDEWGRMYTELTKSQIGVLIYVRAIDPYGNGINIKANLIADFLKISRNAVYEAVRVLCEKDYLMAEGVEYTMRLYHKGILNNSNSDSCQSGTQVSFSDDSNIPGLQQLSGDDSSNFQMKNVTPRLKSAPETSSEQEVETLKINKTYTDFKDSLSEEERESFFKFGEEMSKQLPKPPQLISKWIAKNWEEIRDEWLKVNNKPSMKLSSKWANHLHRAEWLTEINTIGAVSFMCDDEGNVDPERKEFFEWAEATHLIEWGCNSHFLNEDKSKHYLNRITF